MKEKLSQILEQAKNEIEKVSDNQTLQDLRVKYLGKKGQIKEMLGELGKMAADARKEFGQKANQAKQQIELLIKENGERIEKQLREQKLARGVTDPSYAGFDRELGYYHPLTRARDKVVGIFQNIGYTVVEGPELEEEHYNFDALNIPPEHPARDDQDSFYIKKGYLMRSQTSPVQIREMEKRKPPIAIIAPGRCYRRDAVDATHSYTFHQIEGLVVDKNISFADLKGTLLLWARMMFGSETKIRLRPDFFPFTEPSAELAVSSPDLMNGKWVEIAGCGMVDPAVFKNVGYDPDVYSGFAFGMGIERIAMILYGIQDIRAFHENDMRLLSQFVK